MNRYLVGFLIVSASRAMMSCSSPNASSVDASTSGGDASSEAQSDAALDGGGGGSSADAATESGAAAWRLVETTDFDSLGAEHANYAVDYAKGRVEMKWSLGQDAWKFLAEWSDPPMRIASSDTISLSASLETTQDVGTAYSANGDFNIWFERNTTIEPGFVGSPIDDPSVTTDTVHFDIHHGTPLAKATKMMSVPASALGTAKSGDRVALLVSVYNGRAIGTRYIYEWK